MELVTIFGEVLWRPHHVEGERSTHNEDKMNIHNDKVIMITYCLL